MIGAIFPGCVFFNRLQTSRDIGIDLGTANTLIWIAGEEKVALNEPSVVAADLRRNTTYVGAEAKALLGRTPSDVTTGLNRKPNDLLAVRPLSDGVIADPDAAARMLKAFLERVHKGNDVMASRMVLAIPGAISASERRELRAAGETHAQQVYLVEESLAAAIGAGLHVLDPKGTMIVDIGGGTTDVAVFSFGRPVISESLRVAGDEFTAAISLHLKTVHNLVVGEQTAEDIKMEIGSVSPVPSMEGRTKEVRGQHLLTGLPRNVEVRAEEIREAMAETAAVIVEAVCRTLERLPPELAADIKDQGIILTGGGALLPGMEDLIGETTTIFSARAEDPLLCVVKGCHTILEEFKDYAWALESPEDARPVA